MARNFRDKYQHEFGIAQQSDEPRPHPGVIVGGEAGREKRREYAIVFGSKIFGLHRRLYRADARHRARLPPLLFAQGLRNLGADAIYPGGDGANVDPVLGAALGRRSSPPPCAQRRSRRRAQPVARRPGPPDKPAQGHVPLAFRLVHGRLRHRHEHLWQGPGRQRGRALAAQDPLVLAGLLADHLPRRLGWHNNHHKHPRASFQGMAWWEIDIAGYVLLLLEKMGLVWNVTRQPKYIKSESGEWVLAERKIAVKPAEAEA